MSDSGSVCLSREPICSESLGEWERRGTVSSDVVGTLGCPGQPLGTFREEGSTSLRTFSTQIGFLLG